MTPTFRLLEAAIACAIHDYPSRDPAPGAASGRSGGAAPVRADRAARSPDEALAETLASDFRLNGDLLTYDDPGQHRHHRRGGAAARSVGHPGRLLPGRRATDWDSRRRASISPTISCCGSTRPAGPVALDPFSQGRVVMPSELTRRALRAGLTPHVADRLDLLMAPVSDRQALIRLQNVLFSRAIKAADFSGAERCALRRALLDPDGSPALARRRLGAGEAGGAVRCAGGPVTRTDRRWAGRTGPCRGGRPAEDAAELTAAVAPAYITLLEAGRARSRSSSERPRRKR